MSDSRVTVGDGGSLLMTIVFTVLKLNGVVDWSWVWILSPLWIALCMMLGFIVCVLLIAMVVGLLNV